MKVPLSWSTPLIELDAGEGGWIRLPPRFFMSFAIHFERDRHGRFVTMNPRTDDPPTALEPLMVPTPGPATLTGWRGRLRFAVSGWLAFHLLAMVIAPAAVSPSSEIVQAAWNVCQPYIQILDLNHGYHFFAPEPGDSTLLAYEAERPDGTFVRGRIPNREIVPRLLYHRHFMLTEHMRDAPPELEKEWVGSYAEHLCQKLGAVRVKLTGQIHHLPTTEMVRAGMRLDDPSTYENEELGVFEWKAQ
jgi:hypothetical protein